MSFPNNGHGGHHQQQGYGGSSTTNNWSQVNNAPIPPPPPQQHQQYNMQQYAPVPASNNEFQQQHQLQLQQGQQLAAAYTQTQSQVGVSQIANYLPHQQHQQIHQHSSQGYDNQLLQQQQLQQQQQVYSQHQFLQQPNTTTTSQYQQHQQQMPPQQIHHHHQQQPYHQQQSQHIPQFQQQQLQVQYGTSPVGMVPPPPPPPRDPRHAVPPPPLPPPPMQPPSMPPPMHHQNQYHMGTTVPPPSVSSAIPPPPSVGPTIPPPLPSSGSAVPPPPPPRPYCNLCDISCSNENSFQQHLNGAAHRKKLSQTSTNGQNNQFLLKERGFHCNICNITCPNEFSLKQHLNGEKHKKRITGTTTVPPAVDNNTMVDSSPYQFHCVLCNISCINEFSLLQHMSGVRHKKQAAGGMASVYQCNACNVRCSSEFNLLQHLSGDAHKSRIAELSNSAAASGGGSAAAETEEQQQAQDQWYCDACRVGCPSEESYKQHIVGKRHKKKVAKRDEDLLRGMMQNAEMVPSAVNSNGNGMVPQLTNLSNDAASLPVALSSGVKLESNYDSDEEGLIDEEKEDIGNLYDDFSGPQSSPATQNDEDHASANDDMQESDSDDDDDNDMFGDDTSNTANETNPILKKEEEDLSENDEADMFDDSDEETGSDDAKSTAVPLQEDNVTTLDSGLAFSLDYAPDTNEKSTVVQQAQKDNDSTSDSGPAGKKSPAELGIIFLRDPGTRYRKVFPPQLKNLCANFACVGKACTNHPGRCKKSHDTSYNSLGQEGFDALCEHLYSTRIGWLSAKLLGRKSCRVSLKPKYQQLVGDANGCAVDYSLDTVSSEYATAPDSVVAGKRPPTELGIIFLRDPNIPNSQVFPPQLMNCKGELVTLCADFACVGKQCTRGPGCKLSHGTDYNSLGQEGFDALCEHLYITRIGWLSATKLRWKSGRVSLKPKYQQLVGDANGCAVDYSLDTVSSEYATAPDSVVAGKRPPTELGIIFLRDPNIPNSQIFPPQLMSCKGELVTLCADFACVGKQCTRGPGCKLSHGTDYNSLGQEGFDALCEHLYSTRIGWLSAKLLGRKGCSVSLKPKYQQLMGDANGCAVDYSLDTVSSEYATAPDSGKRPPTELGIIFLRDPNIPNSQVFPPQLMSCKGELVTLCADFACVGKQCTRGPGCKLSHGTDYNSLSQEGFDAFCEHLYSTRIGWLSATKLLRKGCSVSLKPKYQQLMGDANGCAVDYSLDTVLSETTSKSKNAGISWADNAGSTQGEAPLLEQGATVTAPKVLAVAAPSVLKKPRYSNNINAKALPNITRPSSLERSYYQQVHPDKFWAELRNWDFLSDLNRAMKSKGSVKKDQDLNKGTKRTLDESNGANKTKASLPDKFESVTQYKALWAPLLIEEAKAQIMSEVVAAQSSQSTKWIQNAHITMGSEVKAEVSTSARSSSDYEGESAPMEPTVIVRLKRGASIGCQVFPNDLLLFSPTSSAVELALRGIAFDAGSDSSTSHLTQLTKGRFGFIGRALNHRSSSVDGLLVRVSQKLWAQFSSLNELFVIKIGSNVTAVREFNALMRVDKLPLNKYLLGGKVAIEQDSQQLKGKVLDELPIGFQTFLKAKANSSQLDAISAAAREYGAGGFTLIKGPPGTGKSTTLVSTLNALHLRQYQEYYTTIERVTTEEDTLEDYELLASLNKAAKVKPRILVCAPSNAAIDNVIVKIMSDRFVDGKGSTYSPSIVRVGAGSTNPKVSSVGLKDVVNRIIEEGSDVNKLEEIISNGRRELGRLQKEIQKLRARIRAIVDASPYAISSDWEIRIDEENFERTGRVFFVNHRHKTTTFDVPPKNRPIETPANIQRMPHYRKLLDSLTKFVEKHNTDSSNLEKYIILQNIATAKAVGEETHFNQLENHVLNSSHIVLTTLGSAGSRIVEEGRKFEVVVIDEAAQSSEMSTLSALQFGSSHAVLVGDPQQLPATIFSVSGRSTKFDRSLFQRLEEAGHEVHMLNVQYRMHPVISAFPRHIFYGGMLLDGPNVQSPDFGGELKDVITTKFPHFQQFNMLDLDSKEERDGTSLSNRDEAELVLHLYRTIDQESQGLVAQTRVAIITPYSQQVSLLHRMFEEAYGASYAMRVEISTVDAFQGRESSIVIYSCVRAGDKGSGIGFLSDVQRMNVALTRAKNFLFVIARRRSIMVNPYWRDLISYAREKNAIIQVPINRQLRSRTNNNERMELFPNLVRLAPVSNSGG